MITSRGENRFSKLVDLSTSLLRQRRLPLLLAHFPNSTGQGEPWYLHFQQAPPGAADADLAVVSKHLG